MTSGIAQRYKRNAGPVKKPRHAFVSTDDEGSGEENDAYQWEESQDEEPVRKRARNREKSSHSHLATRTMVPAQPLQNLAGMMPRHSTAATMEPSVDNGVEIKEERDENGCHQVITVYIGKHNDVFKFSRDDLLQSPVLSAYIRGRSFIMDPDLIEVDSDLFKSVDEFLKASEFLPCYILEERTADYEPTSAGRLDGIKDYCEQLLRLGKLYILAWRFKILRMKLLIRQKITDGIPGRCRSDTTMLYLVEQIFRDMPGLAENAAADQSEGAQTSDPLKEWLITWLAEHMRRCAQSLQPGVGDTYWYTLDTSPGLSLAVHRARAQMMEKHKVEWYQLEDE